MQLTSKTELSKMNNDSTKAGGSSLVRCDAVVGMALDLSTKKRKSDAADNSEPVPKKRLLLWDKSKVKKSKYAKSTTSSYETNINLEKSRQKQETMSMERFQRYEQAVQEWNAYFGTHYTLLL